LKKRGWGIVKFALKLAVGGGILAYLLGTGRLDLSQVWAARRNWPWLAGAFALLSTQPMLATLRWKWLLAAQGLRVPYTRLLSLTWIGLLFNCVFPSATGGDVVKAYLAAADQPAGKRAEAVTSIIADRVVGLVALMLIAALSLLANRRLVAEHPPLQVCAIVVVLAPLALVAFYLFAFHPRLANNPPLRARIERLPGGRLFVRIYHALRVYRGAPGVVARCVAFSMLIHVVAVIYFYVLARALGLAEHSLARYFFVVPVGLTVSAFGLPLGMGVGQVAFGRLFLWIGGAESGGTALATLYQILLLAMNLLGLGPYLAHRREVQTAETEAEAAPAEDASDA